LIHFYQNNRKTKRTNFLHSQQRISTSRKFSLRNNNLKLKLQHKSIRKQINRINNLKKRWDMMINRVLEQMVFKNTIQTKSEISIMNCLKKWSDWQRNVSKVFQMILKSILCRKVIYQSINTNKTLKYEYQSIFTLTNLNGKISVTLFLW